MSEQGRTPSDDPFGGRQPTSHERMTGVPWDVSYLAQGPAPWDIGHPQPAIARLVSEGAVVGTVLEVGCGTGENALLVASTGRSVMGVDVAETALARARTKAHDRGLVVEFVAADAMQLDGLGRHFDTVLDIGLFHSFDADEQSRYVANLAAVTQSGGTVFVLCFSDEGPATGPHPVRKVQLREAFDRHQAWDVLSIRRDRIMTRFHDEDGAPAWLSTIRRT
jgi:SAM-dependent methyltransferase